jgi:pyrophosphate--fructose-6-phosphate 1-phosphotransferase
MLTAGGLAPCLSSAVAALIERYSEIDPAIELVCYRSGYQGLLRGDQFAVAPEQREKAPLLHKIGGSPIGNSRVKLTNAADCVKRGLVKEGENPLPVGLLPTALPSSTPSAATTRRPKLPSSPPS